MLIMEGFRYFDGEIRVNNDGSGCHQGPHAPWLLERAKKANKVGGGSRSQFISIFNQ